MLKQFSYFLNNKVVRRVPGPGDVVDFRPFENSTHPCALPAAACPLAQPSDQVSPAVDRVSVRAYPLSAAYL